MNQSQQVIRTLGEVATSFSIFRQDFPVLWSLVEEQRARKMGIPVPIAATDHVTHMAFSPREFRSFVNDVVHAFPTLGRNPGKKAEAELKKLTQMERDLGYPFR